jgi:hypothetical protein
MHQNICAGELMLSEDAAFLTHRRRSCQVMSDLLPLEAVGEFTSGGRHGNIEAYAVGDDFG